MAYILCIETSTKACSTAVFENEKLLSSNSSVDENYAHAEKLSKFIDECIKSADISYNDLDAITIGKGPGSYTGLRIGTSTAKGICYALEIPLIAIDSLKIMASSVETQNGLLCPMIDARRMEVYAAIYDSELNEIRTTQADIVDETTYSELLNKGNVAFFGDGAEKCKTVLAINSNSNFIDGIFPDAKNMGRLAHQKFVNQEFENTAYFEPFYLKDFVAGKPKKLI